MFEVNGHNKVTMPLAVEFDSSDDLLLLVERALRSGREKDGREARAELRLLNGRGPVLTWSEQLSGKENSALGCMRLYAVV